MEITADFDPSAVLRHLDAIERQAEELRAALPVEFADWQSEDMGRKRVLTVIWPTSRYRVKRRRRVVRRLRKAGQHERVIVSRRPPLRRELIERFKARFIALLDRSF